MTRSMDRRALLASCAGVLSIGVAGCVGDTADGSATPSRTASDAAATEPSESASGAMDASETDNPPATTETGASQSDAAPRWKTAQLTDVLEDDPFRIQDFSGSPVLLQTFAVWCPKCKRQQEHLAALREDTEDIVVVSLNIDSNENAGEVRAHANENGFDWRFAVAPSDVTKSLIDQFGSEITYPPGAPLVRICPDGAAAMLDSPDSGPTKPPAYLKQAVDSC